MPEFGLFNDEGCVEAQLYSIAKAQRALAAYSSEDDLHIAEVCPEHEGHERDFCEECEDE